MSAITCPKCFGSRCDVCGYKGYVAHDLLVDGLPAADLHAFELSGLDSQFAGSLAQYPSWRAKAASLRLLDEQRDDVVENFRRAVFG